MVPSAHVSRHAQLGRRVKIDGVDAFIDPCVIGPYTIVGRVVMRSANHHTEFLNLYDVMQRRVIGGRSVLRPPGELVRIGAACWLADNVTILEGVQIGNGVIVGAGSVVTKSIPDYAIAVGNPARVVRYRYPDEIVELIKPIDWWNWSDERLRANVELFNLDLATVDACGPQRGAGQPRLEPAGRKAVVSAGSAPEDRGVSDIGLELTLPPGLSPERRDVLLDVASRNDREHGADFLGMVLSGSAGRGMATATSDLDVYVVLTDEGRRRPRHRPLHGRR